MSEEIRHIDPSKMDSIEKLRLVAMVLLNAMEPFSAENTELKKANQELKDIINRLKGEQGRPNITGSGKKPDKDTSCQGKEKEKKLGEEQERTPVPIDRRLPILHPDSADLRPDSVLKFYKTVVVQDLVFKRDNVEYTLAMYYSPSLHTQSKNQSAVDACDLVGENSFADMLQPGLTTTSCGCLRFGR